MYRTQDFLKSEWTFQIRGGRGGGGHISEIQAMVGDSVYATKINKVLWRLGGHAIIITSFLLFLVQNFKTASHNQNINKMYTDTTKE